MLSAAARFSLAAVVLAAVLVVRRGPAALRVRPRQLACAALVGALLLTGGNGLVVLAQSGHPPVPSGIAALLVATVPLILILLRTGLGDRPKLATVAGVVVGLVGLAVLVLPAGGVPAAPVVGGLTVVAAAVCWALGSILTGRLPMPADPFVASVYEMGTGAVLLTLGGLARGEQHGLDLGAVSARSWSGLAYLVVAGSLVAFTAYVWLLQNAPISLVSTYAYVNPVVAVLLGALLVDEAVTGRVLVGGAVIVAAVALVVTTERPRRAPSDQP